MCLRRNYTYVIFTFMFVPRLSIDELVSSPDVHSFPRPEERGNERTHGPHRVDDPTHWPLHCVTYNDAAAACGTPSSTGAVQGVDRTMRPSFHQSKDNDLGFPGCEIRTVVKDSA